MKKNYLLLCVLTTLLLNKQLSAQTTYETLPARTQIINMGVTTQTFANGLKPYGLVYQLLANNQVPVKWIINPSKAKDGIDFTATKGTTGVQQSFRGGCFAIEPGYLNNTVRALLATWRAKGVVIDSIQEAVSNVPVYTTIKSIPRFFFVLDKQNGAIAQGYLVNAEFPASSYGFLPPDSLNCCVDLYAMPHADPVWSTHRRLYTWMQSTANGGCQGALWAACHAVSAIEDMFNPANKSQQTNFLSQKTGVATGAGPWQENALVLWGNHSGGSIPYTYDWPAEPVMQFMGSSQLAHLNGSEQIYLPVNGAGGGWRPTTKIGGFDPTQVDVPSKSPGKAAIMAFGPAWGDPDAGRVMYEAGHSHNKATGPDNVAAQRAFFNFAIWSQLHKLPAVAFSSTPPTVMASGTTQNLSVSASGGSGSYTYLWSASRGTFSSTTSASTVYTPPVNLTSSNFTNIIVTVRVTDACGRVGFNSFPLTVTPGNRTPLAAGEVVTLPSACGSGVQTATVDLKPNDSDQDGDALTYSIVSPFTTDGTTSLNNGVLTFTPNSGFNGLAIVVYRATDPSGAFDTARVLIRVGTPDATTGCFPNEVYTLTNQNYFTLGSNLGTQNGTGAANTGTSLNSAENLYTIAGGTTGNYLNMVRSINNYVEFTNFTYTLRYQDAFNIYWSKQSGGTSATLTAFYSTNGGTTWVKAATYTLTNSGGGSGISRIDRFEIPTGVSGVNRIRIYAGNLSVIGTGTGSDRDVWLDAVDYEYRSCVSRTPQLTNDNFTVEEDVASTLNVLSNDTDPAGSALTITAITSGPSFGKVSINTNNTITYISNYDVSTNDIFTYQACNAEGYCSTATVNVTVNNDGCPANNYLSTPASSGTVNATLLGDNILWSPDTRNYGGCDYLDIGGRAGNNRGRLVMNYSWTGVPTGATITSANLVMKLQSNAGGTQTLSVYRLTQAFTEGTGGCGGSSNGVPSNWTTATTGNSWSTAGGDYAARTGTTPYAATTVTNGTSNGTSITWNIADLVKEWNDGTYSNFGLLMRGDELSTSPNGQIDFHSQEATTAADRPTLTINYSVPAVCSTIPNRAPLALTDQATAQSPASVTVNVRANDADVDPSTTLSVTGASIVSPAGGTVSVVSNNVVYTPPSGYVGTAILNYTLSDGSLTDVGIVRVTCLNAAPDARTDTTSLGSNTTGTPSSVTVAVTANDVDPEATFNSIPISIANGYSISEVFAPSNGSISISGLNITYTPNQNFTGYDVFGYLLAEPAGGCNAPLTDTAWVRVRVRNRLPSATSFSASTNACQLVRIPVIPARVSDPEQGSLTLSVTSVSPSGSGTAVVEGGDIVYTPSNTATGTVTIVYQICDDGVTSLCASNSISVSINSTPVNNPPVAVGDYEEGYMEQDIYVSVKDNDSDPENNDFVVDVPTSSGWLQPQNGTVSVLPNGLIKYTPNYNFIGYDRFQYRITEFFPTPPLGCPIISPQWDSATVVVFVDMNPATKLTISGRVFNDADGLNDNVVDGTLFNNPDGTQLYAYLIFGGIVYDSAWVAPNGTYRLDNASPGTTYTVLLSSDGSKVQGDAAPSATLPTNWVNTGEMAGINNNGSTSNAVESPSTPNGATQVTTQALKNITVVDFGLDKRPVADNVTATAQNNPGGTNTVQVPTLTGSDYEDQPTSGTLSGKTIVISTLPGNATLYYDYDGPGGNAPVALSGSTPIDITNYNPAYLTVDPTFTGAGTVSFTYSWKDAAGFADLTPATVEMPFLGSISGNVFDDGNGLNNSTVDGTGIGRLANTSTAPLYANLLDGSNNVVATVAVNTTTGAYSFNGLTAGSYTVQLSTVQGTVGLAAPSTTLGGDWVNTGENVGTSAGNDGTVDGLLSVTLGTDAVTDANLAINERPTSDDKTPAAQANPGGTNQVTVPTLTGTDYEQTTMGSGNTVVITVLPTNADLYYNGIKITTTNFTITNYDPTKLTVDPTFNGSGTVVFDYHFVDGAGFADLTDATVTMEFLGVSISGTVFNDANGTQDNAINGTGIGTAGTNQLYVYLVDPNTNNVVDVVTLGSGGTYTFNNVLVNTTFTVLVSETSASIGAAAPSATFTSPWVSVGESFGANNAAGTGIEGGTPNATISVSTGVLDITGVNFGLERQPESDNKTATPQLNPGGTVQVTVPTLTGSDAEDGTLGSGNTIIIQTLPTNADLYYDGVRITTTNFTITGYDPSKLKVDPTFNGAGTVNFDYVFVDAAGVKDPSAATVTIEFTELSITGTVYHDHDGLTDGTVDGSPGHGTGEASNGEVLYAYLVNSLGTVVDVVQVATNGTYTLGNADANSAYSVRISTSNVAIGATAPTSSNLSGTWTNTGESFGSNNAAGTAASDASPNGSVAVTTTNLDVTGVNFGIEFGPIAHNKTYKVDPDDLNNITGLPWWSWVRKIDLNNASGTTDTTFNTGSSLDWTGKLSGFDLEDGRYNGSTGTLTTMDLVLDVLPDTSNALLQYELGGNRYQLFPNPVSTDPSYIFWNTTLGKYVLPDFDPNDLKLLVKFAYQAETEFTYSYIDAAGIKGTTAIYKLEYTVALPVNILSFNGRKAGSLAVLDWKVTGEDGITGYQIWRSNGTGNAALVNTQNAKGSLAGITAYQCTDDLSKLPAGTYIYELKYMETNGEAKKGGVAIISWDKAVKDAVSLLPNPADQYFDVMVDAESAMGAVKVSLTDVNGRLVLEQAFNGTSGRINTWELQEGVYNVSVKSEGLSKSFKIVIFHP